MIVVYAPANKAAAARRDKQVIIPGPGQSTQEWTRGFIARSVIGFRRPSQLHFVSLFCKQNSQKRRIVAIACWFFVVSLLCGVRDQHISACHVLHR